MSDVSDVDWLAALIRLYDGNHDKGAGALAEALMPHVAARVAEAEAKALGAVDSLAEEWSGCWCRNMDSNGNQVQARDCPSHGDASCQHMAAGIVASLLARTAALRAEGGGDRG